MRRIVAAIFVGMFCSFVAYVSGTRLYLWAETGQLEALRRMPGGPDFISYSDDGVEFLLLLALYLFFLKTGLHGMFAMCHEIWLRAQGWEP